MSRAGTGFPWHVQIQGSNPQQLTEKTSDGPRLSSDASHPPLTEVNSRSSLSKTLSGRQSLSLRPSRRLALGKTANPSKPSSQTQADQRLGAGPPRHYNVRTIPPWVRDAEEDDLDLVAEEELDSPHAAFVAQHNHAPSNQRLAPDVRRGHPMSSGQTRAERTSRWITFARASIYPREDFDGEIVDTTWLNENFTDYSKPWLAGQDENDPEKGSGIYRALRRKRQVWYRRMQVTILRHPFVPLVFRFTILIFAATAIGLGSSIYHEAAYILTCINQDINSRTPDCTNILGTERVNYYRDPSALMAIIVDAIAIAYTLYITYDEYFSKPLGLRSARAKVRLVLLDLFFIVFQAANLALAFESLTVDEGACAVGDEAATSIRFDRICDRAEALSAVLLVSLVAWLFTFSISILRLVERINTR